MDLKDFDYLLREFDFLHASFVFLWNKCNIYEYDEEYCFDGKLKDLPNHIINYFEGVSDIISESDYIIYDTYDGRILFIEDLDIYDVNLDNYKIVFNYFRDEY